MKMVFAALKATLFVLLVAVLLLVIVGLAAWSPVAGILVFVAVMIWFESFLSFAGVKKIKKRKKPARAAREMKL